MSLMAPPDKIRVPYEDFDGARFNWIGRSADGNQFMAFVTGAFPGRERYFDTTGDWQQRKSWNAVIHKFDSDGRHVGSEAKRAGFDIEGRDIAGGKAWKHLTVMLVSAGLRNPKLCDIQIKPFSTEIEDVVYELEYVHEIDEYDGCEHEYVMLWPNDVMFHPPWDSGEYST